MRSVRAVAVAVAMCGGAAAPAFADVTAFIGANTTPANRQVRGFSLGISLLVVGFEVEYANTTDAVDDPAVKAPSLKTGSGNIFLQSPGAFHGVQPYVTTGGGFYSETLGTRNDTGFALNTGAGVKVDLVGPLRVRVDYRLFKLGSGALSSPSHRIYAGLNLKF